MEPPPPSYEDVTRADAVAVVFDGASSNAVVVQAVPFPPAPPASVSTYVDTTGGIECDDGESFSRGRAGSSDPVGMVMSLLGDDLRGLVDAGDVTLEDAVHMMLPPPLQALQECGELPMVRPWPLCGVGRGRRVGG